MKPHNISVIIVSFNTKDKLKRCLACLNEGHEVIVVDNNSQDGSPEMVETDFPTVRLIRSKTNLGFGVANNKGLEIATHNHALLLNSDCYAHEGAIEKLNEVLQAHPEAVATGGRLLNPDGSLQESIAGPLTLTAVFLEQTLIDRLLKGKGYWRTRPLVANWEQTKQQSYQVDQLTGACILMRKGLEQFDERFFLYCEDTELCKRLKTHGQLLYVPEAVFTHELGSSSRKEPWKGIARYNYGKELYFRIHHSPVAAVICFFLNRMGALLRLLTYTLLLLPKPKTGIQGVKTFWKVLSAPIKGPKRS